MYCSQSRHRWAKAHRAAYTRENERVPTESEKRRLLIERYCQRGLVRHARFPALSHRVWTVLRALFLESETCTFVTDRRTC